MYSTPVEMQDSGMPAQALLVCATHHAISLYLLPLRKFIGSMSQRTSAGETGAREEGHGPPE